MLTIGLHARCLPAGVDAAALQDALTARYAGTSTIAVAPLHTGAAGAPHTLDPQALNGRNRLRLSVFSQPAAGQVLLAAVLDNLGKGAARAAAQNLALMLAARTAA